MTRLILIRHGETLWNTEGRYQGHCDSPLTTTGLRQAGIVAAFLAGRSFAALYSSDLPRALRTAEAIGNGVGLPVRVDRRLREKNFGMIEGMTPAEFEAYCPDQYARFRSCGPDDPVPGGESTRRRYELNVDAIGDLRRRHPDGEVLLVVHGGVLDNLFRHAVGAPLGGRRICSIFNASISTLVGDGSGWTVETWGCIAHLGTRPLDGEADF